MGIRSNEEWLQALAAKGTQQEDALKELRDEILRMIFTYLRRHDRGNKASDPEEARQLAEDCAQETLLSIRDKLQTFRGESRFTTWAYSIAIRTVLGELRRRRWKDVSLDQSRIGADFPAWPIEDAQSPGPEMILQQQEVWRFLEGIIENRLTARQRSVLIAHVFQGMPLDSVAEWLGTNRDNVYKILHDARKKLKRSLIEHGLTQEEILRIFEVTG